MKFRRRNWWFRRMALGLAFAAFAAPAAAQTTVDPYLTDVVPRQGEALSGPDGGAPASELAPASPVQAKAEVAPADRSWVVSRDEAVALGLGALALALAFGLALGHVRRPRVAGL